MSARIVHDYRALAPLLDAERERGRTIALANGCFDLLHVGHIRLVVAARACADVLVLAVNTDASVRSYKGEGRPVVPLTERMEVVGALEGVDFVTSFGEPTAHELLRTLQPDVHVKGTDWTEDSVPEGDLVRCYGGRVAIVGDPKQRSTTELIARLRSAMPFTPTK